ncbi:MAG: membrane dipeptidase [Phycisphaeraceae bacterium]|nr:membrane dipeptidase [Phycisphaeraceae bacterium]
MSVFFDSHLDLAYLAVNRRDMLAIEPLESGGPDQPACVTLLSLRDGNVRFALATIFTERDGKGPEGYADEARAHVVGKAQLEVYLTWADKGLIAIDLCDALHVVPGTGELRGGMGVSEVVAPPVGVRVERLTKGARSPALRIGILMENADPIRSPRELEWWASEGVVAIGLTWAKSSRYATGNSEDPATNKVGITPAGQELVREMDRIGLVHDLSHLSDRATDELLEMTDKPVIASHSNCRAIIAAGPGAPANLQRHLRDEIIREIGRRGGVIGLNLLSQFLIPGGGRDRRATIDEAIAHVERICEITGSRAHVGLGSDADGGISRERLPAGINLPQDFERLTDALAKRGWDAQDVDRFAFGNWCDFWGRVSALTV